MPVPDTYKPSDTMPESKHLRAEDFALDVKWKLKIDDVNLELMPSRDGKPERNRLIVSFAGRQKGLVLNSTNQQFLEARLTKNPNAWVGAEVVLHRTTTQFSGKVVPAFRFIEARAANAPVRQPGEDETVPF